MHPLEMLWKRKAELMEADDHAQPISGGGHVHQKRKTALMDHSGKDSAAELFAACGHDPSEPGAASSVCSGLGARTRQLAEHGTASHHCSGGSHPAAQEPHDGRPETVSMFAAHRAGEGNSWLLDPRLDEARAGIQSTMNRMRDCSDMQAELSQLWENLRDLTTARPAMSEALGLLQQRRRASCSKTAADLAYDKLSEELERRLRDLQKIAATILDEMDGRDPGAHGVAL